MTKLRAQFNDERGDSIGSVCDVRLPERDENFAVGAGEGEFLQVAQAQPTVAVALPGNKRAGRQVGFEGNSITGDGMLHRGQWLERSGPGVEQGAGDGFEIVGAAFHFGIGEFPQMRVEDPDWSLAHEPFAIALRDEGHESSESNGSAPGNVRKRLDAVGGASNTVAADRALFATRVSRRANQRAEFHERLVQCGTGAGEKQGRVASSEF